MKVNSALKSTFLQTTQPLSPLDSSSSSIGFGRLRVEPVYRVSHFVFDAAYDNQLTGDSGSLTGLDVLPSTSPAAFRYRQLGGTIFQNSHGQDFNELDRIFAAYQKDNLQVTVGRQAIGWGRGTVFSAVDVFSPFTPFQFDREWKRGVDAINVEEKLNESSSLQLIYASGLTWESSALGGRLRGAFDKFDYELLVAKRAADTMWAVTSSSPLAGAEIHSELGIFRTPGDFPSRRFLGSQNLVPKAVLGMSNVFQMGNGLTASLEYHYSGFGAVSAGEFNQWIRLSAYQARVARGDTQIYGSQALAASLAYTFNERWSSNLESISSLIDSSGAVIPAVTWDLSDNSSLLATALFAYGAAPSGTQLNSQFGARGQVFILQWRLYD